MQEAGYRDGRSDARNGNRNGGRPSTAPLVANEQNCRDAARLLMLEDEMPALRAFLGEPLESVLHICRWVLANEGSENYNPARMIQAWARKRGRGAWSDRPTRASEIIYGEREPRGDIDEGGERENERLGKLIVQYWVDNPMQFVSLLDEVEAHVTGKNGSRR